jgi:hypothetical protein
MLFRLYSEAERGTTMGLQAFPNLADGSMRPELRIVRREASIVSVNVADVCSDDPEQLYYEDKLGCARGVVFALSFQLVLVLIGTLCWKYLLH